MSRLADVTDASATVLRNARAHEIRYPAAALAYYAFVSLLPLALLVLAAIGEELAAAFVDLTPPFLTSEAQGLVYDSLTAARGRTGASLLAVVVLLWGGFNVVVAFTTSLSRIEGVERPRSIRRRLWDGTVVLGALVSAVVVIAIVTALPAFLPALLAPIVLASVLLVASLTAVFVPLYLVPSAVVTTPTEALPGAIVAAVGWTLLQTVLRVYAISAGEYALYGVLGGIILVLTGLYLAAIVLVLGAIVNAIVVGEP